MFAFFVLIVALTISAVAAYYSIIGLTAIFAAAKIPIIIMGASLEIGKIVSTVWLHKYWNKISLQFKLYLIPAIFILMLITSMGIFGFLSKAHMDQSVPAGDIIAQVQVFDDKIQTERNNIESAKKALQQMDSQVDQMLSRTTDDTGATLSVKIRKQQAQERKSLQNDIAQSQKNIVQLQNEKIPFASQVRKVEAEVGPVRYIAALIYGDNPDNNLLEHAVRWVIILLIFVFDPLAVILILAADQTIEWNNKNKSNPDNHVQEVTTSNFDITTDDNQENIENIDKEIKSNRTHLTEEYIKYISEEIEKGKIKLSDLPKEDQDKILKHLPYHIKQKLNNN